MKNVMERHRKRCEEMQFAGMIWWLILWYATDEGRREVPAEHQWLSCELAAALIESSTKEQVRYSWRYDHAGNVCLHQWDVWPKEMNRLLQSAPMRKGSTAEKRLQLLMRRFVTQWFVHGHGEKDYSSELTWFHESNTPRQITRARFIPSKEMYDKADACMCESKGRYTAQFWCVLPGWIRDIATLMRPHIERDVAYIKQHYSW